MLTKTLLKTGLRDLTRRPLQTALMILGVALGVAVVIAIDLANTAARTAFDLSTQAITGKTTHQIVGGANGIDESLYRKIRIDLGYRLSAPVVEGNGTALDLDAQPLHILGVDFFAEAPFRNFISDSNSASPIDLTRFYTQGRTALIGVGMAERYNIKQGDSVRVQINDQIIEIVIAGVLTPSEANSRRALDGLMIMDIASAQESLGMIGKLSRIDLIATDDQVKQLQNALPSNTRIVNASEQSNTVAQLTSAFQLNLTALSLLALIVGMFLIYNTMMFSVVQRRAVFGIMRALGVTGAQLFTLIIAEAAIASFIGAIIGLGLGWVLGQGAVKLVTQTINDLYFSLTVSEAPLTLFTAIKGLGLGIGAGMLAAAAPAAEASGVEPITAMRSSSFEDRVKTWIPIIAWIGAALIGVGATLLIFQSLIFSFIALFAIVIGLAMIVPIATNFFMRVVTMLPFGLLSRLAARTVTKAISRTSVAIASLMVAVSVTIGVSLMIDSFRATVINWLDLTLRADVYISAGVRVTSLTSDLPARIASVEGVDHVETFRATRVESEFGVINLSVIDARRQRDAKLYRFADGSPQQIWDQVINGAVIVSEPFAHKNSLPTRGATITMQTDKGLRTFPVIAIYYDYSSDRGAVMMSQNVYQQWWDDRGITSVAVYVKNGYAPEAVADSMRTLLRGTALQVQVNRALREQALTIFDRTFAITNALRILAVVVAFIGVLSALMALQIERTRELATMQAVGLTENQLWRLTFLETGLMGATAGLLSMPTGFILALVLIYVINLRSFGWTIQMEMDASIFVQAMIVSVMAALLAAVYPLMRLRGMEIAVGLRRE